MNIFPILKDDDVPEGVRPIFQEIDKLYGTVPAFYRVLATSQPLVQAYWHTFKNVISEGTLPSQVKELIFLAISRKLRCVYCASIHLAICDMVEIDRSTLDLVIAEAANIQPERVAALLTFCLSAIDDPDAITEKQYHALNDQGISQKEILEALCTVSYSIIGVGLAKSLKLDIDQDIKDYLKMNKLSIGFI